VTAEIIRFRSVRKDKARQDRETEAALNRAKHGRSRQERELDAARKTIELKRHEGNRLGRTPSSDDEPTGA
jgi:hypothetical protein